MYLLQLYIERYQPVAQMIEDLTGVPAFYGHLSLSLSLISKYIYDQLQSYR